MTLIFEALWALALLLFFAGAVTYAFSNGTKFSSKNEQRQPGPAQQQARRRLQRPPVPDLRPARPDEHVLDAGLRLP